MWEDEGIESRVGWVGHEGIEVLELKQRSGCGNFGLSWPRDLWLVLVCNRVRVSGVIMAGSLKRRLAKSSRSWRDSDVHVHADCVI